MARQSFSNTPEEREIMIREAAYYRYLEHGCSDGHDVEDWLAAEAELEARAKHTLSLKARPAAGAADKLKRVVAKAPRGAARPSGMPGR